MADGRFGEISSGITMAASQSVRRNAANNGFEAFTPGAGGVGDVVGPAGATDGNLALFDTATGKLLKDGGPPPAAGITLLDVYPIGAIYISIANTDPGTLFGGTWAAFGAGRVLVGLNGADPDFDTAEETGGAKTVQSSAQTFAGNELATHQHAAKTAGTPAGTNTAPAFTGTQSTVVVNHVHVQNEISGSTGSYTGSPADTSAGGTGGTPSQVASSISTANPTGGSASYTPAGSVAAPAFTGTEMATHQHDGITAGTPAGTNTPGAATSVVQPYIVVYMFKRTA